MTIYRPEAPADAPAIERLLDRAFGPNRQAKASYGFRRGIAPRGELSRVAVDAAGSVVGTIRYWPIRVGEAPALLLGPVGVTPELQGQGIGRRLIHDTLQLAAAGGARAVFLVGDPAYYRPLGFLAAGDLASMPNEDPTRLHGLPLGSTTTLPRGVLRSAALRLPAAS